MEFRYETHAKVNIHDLFEFHRDPANLAVLHEGMPGFRMLDHRLDPTCVATFRLTVFGLFPVVLSFERVLDDPPNAFGEELIRGMFLRFRHEHHFESTETGTTVRDVLLCKLPVYFGGELSLAWLVKPHMDWVFRWRHQALNRLVAEGAIGTGAA